MKALKFVLITVTAFTLIACGQSNTSPELASVNGKSITNAQFDAYLKFKRAPAKDEKRREKLLDQYVEREALASVIENESVLDKDLIQAEFNEFRKEMLISRYFEKYLKDKVPDQAVHNYYNTHATDYEQQKMHVAHVLIRTNRKMTEPERKAKLTTAQEAYSKIRAGEDFSEIAKNYSEDKISGQKGGDLGWLKKGSISKQFTDKVFNMKPGDVSEPFETPFGFHVVKVIDEPKTIKRPFKAVSGDIRYQLRAQAKKAEMERLLTKTQIKKD